MKKQTRDILVVGFALFSMFFGAGNVIFPPYLGMGSGPAWLAGFVSYYLADIGLALFAIFAMLRVGSDVDGVTCRIGKVPGRILSCAIILCVGPLLAIPRTAATTYEMTVVPLMGDVGAVLFSILFFALILVLCVKESSVVDIVGKVLTPILFAGLIILIFKGVTNPIGPVSQQPMQDHVIVNGITSGYQTMDVLAALIFGVIILKTVSAKGYADKRAKARVVVGAGLVAAAGLLVVYCGLTYLGATASTLYTLEVNRAALVVEIIQRVMGRLGIVIFGVVVALACVTTAVALVSSSSSYFARLSGGRISYRVLVTVICAFSALVTNFGLDTIIALSSPILNVVYPGALTLIVLSFSGNRIKNQNIYKGATLGAIMVSFLETLAGYGILEELVSLLPLSAYGFGWVLPAILCGVASNFIKPCQKVELGIASKPVPASITVD